MTRLTALFLTLLLLASQASAKDWDCSPMHAGGTGVGYVASNDAATGEQSGWWCAYRWTYKRQYMVRLPGHVMTHPDVKGLTTLAAANAYRAANVTADCYPRGSSGELLPPTPAAIAPLCERMERATNGTRPPNPVMVVDKATARDGTRPTYRLNVTTKQLEITATRALAGSTCDCFRQAWPSGVTNYCSAIPASATPLLAACVRR